MNIRKYTSPNKAVGWVGTHTLLKFDHKILISLRALRALIKFSILFLKLK